MIKKFSKLTIAVALFVTSHQSYGMLRVLNTRVLLNQVAVSAQASQQAVEPKANLDIQCKPKAVRAEICPGRAMFIGGSVPVMMPTCPIIIFYDAQNNAIKAFEYYGSTDFFTPIELEELGKYMDLTLLTQVVDRYSNQGFLWDGDPIVKKPLPINLEGVMHFDKVSTPSWYVIIVGHTGRSSKPDSHPNDEE